MCIDASSYTLARIRYETERYDVEYSFYCTCENEKNIKTEAAHITLHVSSTTPLNYPYPSETFRSAGL
jgi:hypothetical protein